jgi:hypothetical protein
MAYRSMLMVDHATNNPVVDTAVRVLWMSRTSLTPLDLKSPMTMVQPIV